MAIPPFDTDDGTADLPPYHELAYIRFEGTSPAPPPEGLIMMWTGSSTTPPTGWVLCDGNEGTPDLRNRFIRGTTTGEDPGSSGGGIPHSHTAGPLSVTTGWAGATLIACMTTPVPPAPAVSLYAHAHDVNIPAFSTQDADPLPPYTTLAFIMYEGDASGVNDAANDGLRDRLTIDPSVLNSFSPRAMIHYVLSEPQQVSLLVHDVSGRLVRTLKRSIREDAGRHEAEWDGLDDSGRQIPSGTYFVRLSGEFGNEVQKVMMVP
jgi:hypothetical protein